MKHPFLLPILSLAMLTACNSTPTDKKEPEVQVKKEKRKANIIKKPLNIPYEFSYITNMGSVDIIYTQGQRPRGLARRRAEDGDAPDAAGRRLCDAVRICGKTKQTQLLTN